MLFQCDHYSDNLEMSMGISAARYGWKCSENGLTPRGGGGWALLGCYYKGKIIFCILAVISGFSLQ